MLHKFAAPRWYSTFILQLWPTQMEFGDATGSVGKKTPRAFHHGPKTELLCTFGDRLKSLLFNVAELNCFFLFSMPSCFYSRHEHIVLPFFKGNRSQFPYIVVHVVHDLAHRSAYMNTNTSNFFHAISWILLQIILTSNETVIPGNVDAQHRMYMLHWNYSLCSVYRSPSLWTKYSNSVVVMVYGSNIEQSSSSPSLEPTYSLNWNEINLR